MQQLRFQGRTEDGLRHRPRAVYQLQKMLEGFDRELMVPTSMSVPLELALHHERVWQHVAADISDDACAYVLISPVANPYRHPCLQHLDQLQDLTAPDHRRHHR